MEQRTRFWWVPALIPSILSSKPLPLDNQESSYHPSKQCTIIRGKSPKKLTIDLHCFTPKKMGNLMIPVVLKIGEYSEWKTWTPTSLIWFQWEMLGLLLLEGFRIHSLKSFGSEMSWGHHCDSSYGRFLLRYRHTQKYTQKNIENREAG